MCTALSVSSDDVLNESPLRRRRANSWCAQARAGDRFGTGMGEDEDLVLFCFCLFFVEHNKLISYLILCLVLERLSWSCTVVIGCSMVFS